MARVLCIGQAVQDFVFHVDELPSSAEKYRAHHFESVGGGPAATAAVAIQRLGGDASLAARVGDDAIGRTIVGELEDFGVDCSLVRECKGHSSSLSSVLVDSSGERLIVNYLDPDLDTDPSWLPEIAGMDVDAVLVDTRWPEGGLRGLEMARRAGIPGILDADLPVPSDGELLRAASHVAFSTDGLAQYTGNDDLESALRHVTAEIDAWCCVTVGREGTMQLDGDRPEYSGAFDVPVTDTLGAGDVWHGAFALGLATGQEIAEAVRFAGAAAAVKVREGGGRGGAPTLDDVQRLLQDGTMESPE